MSVLYRFLAPGEVIEQHDLMPQEDLSIGEVLHWVVGHKVEVGNEMVFLRLVSDEAQR